MDSFGQFLAVLSLSIAAYYGFFKPEWRKIQANDKRDAARRDAYKETIPLTIPYNPSLTNGDRLSVTVFLSVFAYKGTLPDEVSTEVQRVAQSEISLWALTFKEPKDAVCPDMYESLRSRLAKIAGETYRVTLAKVVSITAPKARTKEQVLTMTDHWLAEVRTVRELHLSIEFIKANDPDLWNDPVLGGATENGVLARKVESKTQEILNPGDR